MTDRSSPERDQSSLNRRISRREFLKLAGVGAGGFIIKKAKETLVGNALLGEQSAATVSATLHGKKAEASPAPDRFIPPDDDLMSEFDKPFSFSGLQEAAFRDLEKDLERRGLVFNLEETVADLAHSFGEVRAVDIVNFAAIVRFLEKRADLSQHLRRVAEVKVSQDEEYQNLGEYEDYPWSLNPIGWERLKGDEVTALNLALYLSLAACESNSFSHEVSDLMLFLRTGNLSVDLTNAHGGANAQELILGLREEETRTGGWCAPRTIDDIPPRHRGTFMTLREDIHPELLNGEWVKLAMSEVQQGKLSMDGFRSRLSHYAPGTSEAASVDQVVHRTTAMMTCLILWLRTASLKKEAFPFKDKQMEEPDMTIIGQFPGTDRSTPEKAQAIDGWLKNFNDNYRSFVNLVKDNPASGFVVHGNLLDKESESWR